MTTDQQRRVALRAANKERFAHAQWRREARALPYGEACGLAADLLEDEANRSPKLDRMRVSYFLKSIPWIGDVAMDKVYEVTGISSDSELRLEALTSVERHRLATELRVRAVSGRESAAARKAKQRESMRRLREERRRNGEPTAGQKLRIEAGLLDEEAVRAERKAKVPA